MNLLQSFFLWFKHDFFCYFLINKAISLKEQFFSGEIKGCCRGDDFNHSFNFEQVSKQKSKGVFIFSCL